MKNLLMRALNKYLTGFADLDEACIACDFGQPVPCLKNCERTIS